MMRNKFVEDDNMLCLEAKKQSMYFVSLGTLGVEEHESQIADEKFINSITILVTIGLKIVIGHKTFHVMSP